MSMYVVVLSDIELGLIESLRVGMTLSGAPTGALSIPAALTSTHMVPYDSCMTHLPWLC
jgi:hypothetical protein